MGKYNVHGGHDAQGKGANGASCKIDGLGWFHESVEDRNVKNDVITYFKQEGHTTYDCTVDSAGSQSANLSQIVAKCNAHAVDRDISIHFNSGRNNPSGDGSIGGVEIFLYDSSDSKLVADAKRICTNISKLGFKNRGVKYNNQYTVLKKTKSKAMIIEVCFVDDKDDVLLYRKVGSKAIAKAIVEGILNKTINENTIPTPDTTVYKIVTGGFGSKENAQTKANYLQGITGWFLEVKPVDGDNKNYCIHTGGFTGKEKVEKKMNALKEISGWWMEYRKE